MNRAIYPPADVAAFPGSDVSQCTDIIDGYLFRDMILSATVELEARKREIDELNVFPFPDKDTGANMSATMGAAGVELRDNAPPLIGETAELTAAALLRGARGNSGTILVLLFRGFSHAFKGKAAATAAEFALAMEQGVSAAYKGVMKPQEGTILTVSRLAAEAALESAKSGDGIKALLKSALDAARTGLSDTTNQIPALKKAGVVDAGGLGYTVILEAMLRAAHGETSRIMPGAGEFKPESVFPAVDAGETDFNYCAEFIVLFQKSADRQHLRTFLASAGISVVIADDAEMMKAHAHTGKPGELLAELLAFGGLLTFKVEDMRGQQTRYHMET
ncbi:MAG: DAK2 domain-containing protein [Treponema sp.]|jgi:DAK2 domain fusion protein YloV|nr:DAK2 domain-containing protein [Treponema sp.]